MDAIGEGVLIAINKPNKEQVVSQTRPITLVNIIRKTLSIIVLDRIYPIMDRYIHISQNGYRKYRGTTDILWTYRFLLAMVKRYDESYNIMGIDLSKAFDCIDRVKVLQELEKHIDESSYRIIQYLLSHTYL